MPSERHEQSFRKRKMQQLARQKKKRRARLVLAQDATPLEVVKAPAITPALEVPPPPPRPRKDESSEPDEIRSALIAERQSTEKILKQLLGDDGAFSFAPQKSSESTAESTPSSSSKPPAEESKKKKKRKKNDKPVTSPGQISSNWQKLKETLPPPKKRFRPRVEPEAETSAVTDDSASAAAASSSSSSSSSSRGVPVAVQQKQQKALALTELRLRPGDTSLTKHLALDCEMVGVGEGGSQSVLARVSLVNAHGNGVYDRFVLPPEPVTDYRTRWSGIRPADLVPSKALPFAQVQKEVADLLRGRVLVGHALRNDLRVLMLSHPFNMTRDTSKYRPLQKTRGMPRALRHLVKYYFGTTIQSSEHSSVEDARASMLLYLLHRKDWEEKVEHRMQRLKKFSKQHQKKKKQQSRAQEEDGEQAISVPLDRDTQERRESEKNRRDQDEQEEDDDASSVSEHVHQPPTDRTKKKRKYKPNKKLQKQYDSDDDG